MSFKSYCLNVWCLFFLFFAFAAAALSLLDRGANRIGTEEKDRVEVLGREVNDERKDEVVEQQRRLVAAARPQDASISVCERGNGGY